MRFSLTLKHTPLQTLLHQQLLLQEHPHSHVLIHLLQSTSPQLEHQIISVKTDLIHQLKVSLSTKSKLLFFYQLCEKLMACKEESISDERALSSKLF